MIDSKSIDLLFSFFGISRPIEAALEANVAGIFLKQLKVLSLMKRGGGVRLHEDPFLYPLKNLVVFHLWHLLHGNECLLEKRSVISSNFAGRCVLIFLTAKQINFGNRR